MLNESDNVAVQNETSILKAGICDDEQYAHDEVEKLLMEYNVKNNVNISLTHYYSAKELLEKNDALDFLFLDIEMKEMDGIEAAYKLRNRKIDYKIIMLSAREDRYRDAFRINAFRFVSKPIEEQEFFRAINDVCEQFCLLEKVTVYQNGRAYQIAQQDIAYIMSNRSASNIYTLKSMYRSENSLTAWLQILDKGSFFQCHKSYIVNMGRIEEIMKEEALLVTGEKVKVSRRSRTAFLNAFMEYDTSHH